MKERTSWRTRFPSVPWYTRRQTALTVLSALSAVWGLGLLVAPPTGRVSPLYDVVMAIMSPLAWGVTWISAGVFALTVALTRYSRDRAAFGLIAGLFITWAAGTAVSWLQSGTPHGFVLPLLLFLVGALIIVISGWPE